MSSSVPMRMSSEVFFMVRYLNWGLLTIAGDLGEGFARRGLKPPPHSLSPLQRTILLVKSGFESILMDLSFEPGN